MLKCQFKNMVLCTQDFYLQVSHACENQSCTMALDHLFSQCGQEDLIDLGKDFLATSYNESGYVFTS